MKPFLEQVARHYYGAGSVERLCFIFPNRRAMVFFRKYLGECAVEDGRTILSPKMFTMNDFFYENAGMHPTDEVRLLLELYDCYKALNPTHETLDDFIFWGGVLLSDFNDVDKYLVNPKALFTNVSDFRALGSGEEALNETQRAAVERFISHFKSPSSLKEKSRYKEEFRRIWDILYPLYEAFGKSLSEKGCAYEGMVYRSIAESLKEKSAADVLGEEFGDTEKFVFVGLNALNECEKLLIRKLQRVRLAEFCWDYSGKRIRNLHNKSSFFLESNVAEFPQAFPLDSAEPLPDTQYHVLGVPSVVGQAKQLPAILKELKAKGLETAVVLPDETLLLSVLNSIPEEIKAINVTMGYPMNGSGIWTFMNDVAALQMHLRKGGAEGSEWMFYHRSVSSVFASSVFKAACDDAGEEIVSKVVKDAHYYISPSSFKGSHLLEVIFRPVVLDPKDSSGETAAAFGKYLLEVIGEVAPLLKERGGDMAIELDFAREYYLAIERLNGYHLALRPDSFLRLLERTVGRATVPFRGEPLGGLQIMGPLETRAVDFDNVVILSCNEGIFPRRNVASSFIPPELRRGFALPTYEYQDAVWAYYFYRLTQRAKQVWMLYDSHSEGLKAGEESRYIKQLELHFGANLKRHNFISPVGKSQERKGIPKTQEHIDTIRNQRKLSATSLQNYIICKAKFYYGTVLGLSKSDEVEESLDARLVGTVFHSVMQRLYAVKGGHLTKTYLKSLLEGDTVKRAVGSAILENLKCSEMTGRNIVYEDMICSYVLRTISYDLSLLENNHKDEFEILGLEERFFPKIGDFRFCGIIDRLDSISPGEWRVVDYKTGKVGKFDTGITDENAALVVDRIFTPSGTDWPKIALQLYLYDRFVVEKKGAGSKKISNAIYGISEILNGRVPTEEKNDTFTQLMDERLEQLLQEIADVSVPFSLTDDPSQCEKCDFKNICGR